MYKIINNIYIMPPKKLDLKLEFKQAHEMLAGNMTAIDSWANTINDTINTIENKITGLTKTIHKLEDDIKHNDIKYDSRTTEQTLHVHTLVQNYTSVLEDIKEIKNNVDLIKIGPLNKQSFSSHLSETVKKCTGLVELHADDKINVNKLCEAFYELRELNYSIQQTIIHECIAIHIPTDPLVNNEIKAMNNRFIRLITPVLYTCNNNFGTTTISYKIFSHIITILFFVAILFDKKQCDDLYDYLVLQTHKHKSQEYLNIVRVIPQPQPNQPPGLWSSPPLSTGRAPQPPSGRGRAPQPSSGRGRAPQPPSGRGRAPQPPSGRVRAPQPPSGRGRAPQPPSGRGRGRM
jgi:hypothetical protein